MTQDQMQLFHTQKIDPSPVRLVRRGVNTSVRRDRIALHFGTISTEVGRHHMFRSVFFPASFLSSDQVFVKSLCAPSITSSERKANEYKISENGVTRKSVVGLTDLIHSDLRLGFRLTAQISSKSSVVSSRTPPPSALLETSVRPL